MAFAWSRRCLQQQQLSYLLAHMNYARLRAPLDHPSMTEFRLALDPINAIARSTPGFVWSLDDSCTAPERDAVPLLRHDALLMPQLSLWRDVSSVQHFAFKSGHAMYLKRKREWFTTADVEPPFAVCWWFAVDPLSSHSFDGSSNERLPAVVPTLAEAFEKCQHLKEHGPTAEAFTFQTAKDYPMPPPAQTNSIR